MVVKLAENIGCKLSGVTTIDIDGGAYMKTHIMLDAVMLLILAASVLPLFRMRKWLARTKTTTCNAAALILLHGVLPTVLMLIPTILGSPMWVALRFAPDLALTLIVSSVILYLTGAAKVISIVRNGRNLESGSSGCQTAK